MARVTREKLQAPKLPKSRVIRKFSQPRPLVPPTRKSIRAHDASPLFRQRATLQACYIALVVIDLWIY